MPGHSPFEGLTRMNTISEQPKVASSEAELQRLKDKLNEFQHDLKATSTFKGVPQNNDYSFNEQSDGASQKLSSRHSQQNAKVSLKQYPNIL